MKLADKYRTRCLTERPQSQGQGLMVDPCKKSAIVSGFAIQTKAQIFNAGPKKCD